MTPADLAAMTSALAPVRRALLERARADAQRLLDAADAEAAETRTRAEQEAARLLAEARAQGEADATVLLAAVRAHARREARGIVLRAEREAYDDLRRRSVTAVCALRADPAYAAMREALLRAARAELGPRATVRDDPAGGVVAEVLGRRVEFTLSSLAHRTVDDLGPAAEELWAP